MFEVKALKAQLKREKQNAAKLKKENSKLKKMLILLSMFIVILARMLFENLKVKDVLSLPWRVLLKILYVVANMFCTCMCNSIYGNKVDSTIGA